MKRIFVAMAMLAACSAVASIVVLFNPDSTPVANRVTRVLTSANELEYAGKPGALVDVQTLPAGTVNDWKVEGGAVVLLTQADLDAITLANWLAASNSLVQFKANLKAELVASIDADDDREARLIRAMAEVMLDEVNNHALTINAILDAADAASNLATFKTAMAAITDIPPRTLAQMKTAIQNKLSDD